MIILATQSELDEAIRKSAKFKTPELIFDNPGLTFQLFAKLRPTAHEATICVVWYQLAVLRSIGCTRLKMSQKWFLL